MSLNLILRIQAITKIYCSFNATFASNAKQMHLCTNMATYDFCKQDKFWFENLGCFKSNFVAIWQNIKMNINENFIKKTYGFSITQCKSFLWTRYYKRINIVEIAVNQKSGSLNCIDWTIWVYQKQMLYDKRNNFILASKKFSTIKLRICAVLDNGLYQESCFVIAQESSNMDNNTMTRNIYKVVSRKTKLEINRKIYS